MGRIPDGILDFIGDTIRVLAASDQSVADLRRLRTIVRDGRHERRPPSEIVHAIKQESPELASLVGRLIVPRTPSDFYAFLQVLLAAIALVLVLRGQEAPSTDINIDIHQQVDQVIEKCWEEVD